LVERAQPFTLLTPGIAREYGRLAGQRSAHAKLAAQAAFAKETPGAPANAQLFTTSLEEFLSEPELSDEIFGPDTLLVQCQSPDEYVRAASALDGHLTATVLGSEEDLAAHRNLISILEQKAGRLIFNGFPTGVEVAPAMVHGGPYPSTSDARYTSVGSGAIFRFAKPVCFQNFPDALVPAELQTANPLGILRLIDGVPSRDTLVD
jgi:NADP-dependent aldehyde dehydrogenase